jgi:hypothetical protein
VKRYGRKEFQEFWKSREEGGSDWFSFSTEGPWMWYSFFGYSISHFVFYIADFINVKVLPAKLFQDHALVEKIATATFGCAKVVSLIAPVVTAPIWEEVFYRGNEFCE